MALPPLATLDELETWAGSSVDPARAEAVLSAASTLIRSYTGRMWVDAAGDPEATASVLHLQAVAEVTVRIAHRVYINPTGISQQAAGPFSHSVAAWAAAGMTLTDEDKGLLPNPVGGVNGLSSVRVVAPTAARGSLLCVDDEVVL